MDRRLAVSYHEAGHAVIGLVLQLDVREALISAVRDRPGYWEGVTEVRASELRGPSWRDRQVLMLFAGHLARHHYRPPAWSRDVGSLTDRAWIYHYLRCIRQRWAAYQHQARQLVRGHWAAIEAVAYALYQHEHLDRAALCDLVTRARSPVPPTWNGIWYPPCMTLTAPPG